MSLEMPADPDASFRPRTSPSSVQPTALLAPTRAAPPRPWWRRTVSGPAAAGVIGSAVLAGASVLVVAHAWSEGPKPLAEATHVIGGMIVALLVIAAFAVGTRMRALGDLVVAAAFSLAAHGASLVIQGATVGTIFLGLAPIVGVLAHVAFMRTPIAPIPHTSARLDIAWAIAKSRRKTACGARRAASPNHLVMHA
jgi:hypothetical protein